MNKLNSETEQHPRTPGGRFSKGTSGNLAGRPPGSANKSTLLAAALLQGQSEQLTQKAIELALEGDPWALRLCMERILPVCKERVIDLALPQIHEKADTAPALATVVTAVAEGQFTPGEGEMFGRMLEAHLIEDNELEKRVSQLEQALKDQGEVLDDYPTKS